MDVEPADMNRRTESIALIVAAMSALALGFAMYQDEAWLSGLFGFFLGSTSMIWIAFASTRAGWPP